MWQLHVSWRGYMPKQPDRLSGTLGFKVQRHGYMLRKQEGVDLVMGDQHFVDPVLDLILATGVVIAESRQVIKLWERSVRALRLQTRSQY
jgi:hypothetical protein